MSSFQHILVSTDLADTSDQVLDYALEFASKVGARVTALHVYSLPVYNLPDGSFVPTAEVAANIAKAAQDQLDATVARHNGRGVPLTGLLRNGSPQAEIGAVAKEIGADVIVVGTHARGAFGRALLGSVANTVIRTSAQPVITVRTGKHS